jgi:hypothetical protein
MKRITTVALLVVAIAFAAFGGYWAGFKKGVVLGGAASALSNGAVAVAEIGLLDRGKPDKAMYLLEAAVDDGLFGWNELTSSREARMSLALLGSDLEHYRAPWLDENYVRRLANYRKAHQSPQTLPASVFDLTEACRGEPGCWDLRPLRQRETTITSITDRYAR